MSELGQEPWAVVENYYGSPDDHFLGEELYWDFTTLVSDYEIESWLKRLCK